MRKIEDMKVLILQPFLNFYGGAEYQLKVVVNDIFPQADIATFSYKDEILKELSVDNSRVIPLLGTGIFSKLYKQITPFYPALIDSFEVDSSYDLVFSFSYGYVHGVVTDNHTPHIGHIETPMRLLWEGESAHYWYDKVPIVREIYRTILASQRLWDRQAATRPDYLLSNSQEISDRIKRVWNRNTEILHPPVDTEFYRPDNSVKKEDYYVTHSRLVRYKRIDLLIDAAKKAKKKLIVIGDGPAYRDLKSVATKNADIIFTGYVSHEEKRDLLQKAQGFWYASHEDFGIAPVEAMAAGLPVLAYGRGGATETVTNETGLFYYDQTVQSLSEKIPSFEKLVENYNVQLSIKRASEFSKEAFVAKTKSKIVEYCRDFEQKGPPILD